MITPRLSENSQQATMLTSAFLEHDNFCLSKGAVSSMSIETQSMSGVA